LTFSRPVTTASGKLAGIAMGALGDGAAALGPVEGDPLDAGVGATAAAVGEGEGLGSQAARTTVARARAARRRGTRCIRGMVVGRRTTGGGDGTAAAGTDLEKLV
jgi:hypothetical protein